MSVCTVYHVYTCVNLVFLQSDLAHLSVADKGACHLVDPFSCSHSDDVVGRYEPCSLSNLPLLEQMPNHEHIVQRSFET